MRRVNLIIAFAATIISCGASESTELISDVEDSESESTTVLATHYVSSAEELDELDDLVASDVVVWRSGTYNDEIVKYSGSATLMAEKDGEVVFTGESYMIISGTNATIRGFKWDNPTPVSGKPIIKLNSGSSNCKVEECVIIGSNLNLDPDTDTKWVSLYGTQHSVCNCSFIDKRNIGTTFVVWFEEGVTPNHTIENNYFTRPQTIEDDDGSATNGQETIRIGTSDWSMSSGECTVRGNHFHNCHGERAEIISNKSCDNLYEENLFTESMGTLTLRHGNDCIVRNNYFIGEGMSSSGGVRIIGEGHTVEDNYMESLMGDNYTSSICIVRGEEDAELSGYWQVKDAMISGNTIVDCNVGITSNYGARSTMTMAVITTTVSNNTIIMSSEKDYSIYNITSPEPDITWIDNMIYSGRELGVDLPTLTTMPSYTRPTNQIESIIATAGASYYEK
ncbi:MAG: polysaccharide lyase 6 family protein [Rikenellaceae bacterium]